MKRRKLTGLVFIVFSLLIPITLHAEVELRFGVRASDKPTTIVKRFRPVLNALESGMAQHLGMPVTIKMQVARNRSQSQLDLVTGKVDFARFGPNSYITSKQANPGIRILAMENHKGGKIFHGIICVRQDSLIQHASELRGKSFAFGNERSIIGRYLAQTFLLQHGITVADLARFAYLGGHNKVGTAVGAGDFDAGALRKNTFNKLVAKGVPLRAIAVLPFVTKSWVVRSGLPEHLYLALRHTLLHMKGPKALKLLERDGFLPGNDEDYDVIRASMAKAATFVHSEIRAKK